MEQKCDFNEFFRDPAMRRKFCNKLADYQGQYYPFVEPQDIVDELSSKVEGKMPKWGYSKNFDLEKWAWACCLRLLKQQRHRFYTNKYSPRLSVYAVDMGPNPSRDNTDDVDRTYVTEAVEQLPDLEKDLIYSHTYNDESFRSLSRKHGLSVYTTINTYQKALLQLKRLLSDQPT